jgi:hypothetical protein
MQVQNNQLPSICLFTGTEIRPFGFKKLTV